MSRFKVYLAGPIAGLTFDEGQDWRSDVCGALQPHGIDAYSPLRKKHFLRGVGAIGTSAYGAGRDGKSVLATDRGIMTRDHWDCQTSDLILVNLLNTKRVTIGTVMEIAWAFAYRKPLIVVMEAENNLHDHPMIREAIGYRVTTIDEAISITLAVLLPHADAQ